MILFYSPDFDYLARSFSRDSKMRVGRWSAKRFPNGELYIELKTPVRGERCAVFGTLAPPERQLVTALLLCHTLKQERAKEVTAVFPYLAYARQDKAVPGESRATPWLGNLLEASGVSRVITIDIHSREAARQLRVPVVSLSGAGVLARTLEQSGLAGATLVAPDYGALAVCRRLQAALGISGPIAYFEKTRTHAGVKVSNLIGSASWQAILADDMLDTGGTLVHCAERLRRRGVRDIYIAVTHGLFTGEKWKRLWQLGVKHIWCADTIPQPPEIAKNKKITIVSVRPLLEAYLT